ncbi:hypothetical protein H4R19_006936, partial [Coemansia spiralis]
LGMDTAPAGKAASGSSSGGERRLPSNAQSSKGVISGAVAQDIRRPSMARATDRLVSQPSSLARSWQQQQRLEGRRPAPSNGEESDASGSGGEALDEAAIARRVKRHLVTHIGEASGTRRSVGGRLAAEGLAGVDYEVEEGYAGDDNDDDDRDDDRVVADPLTLPSGDMTYGIYRWHQAHGRDEGSARQRRGSFSGVASDAEWEVPYSQRQMNMPGGFRRQFLHDQAAREGRLPAGMAAASFVDFIGLYGHFAGSEYPSDEDEPVDSGEVTVQTPLLQQRQQQREAERSIHATASSRKAFFLL